ncbi:MAG: LLM class flavin-dependent oxidoreductase [Thaumarchaeota archaeon]|jgi:alkanesulfonate monooxygenase SsuD/methylene tetrahydromethanopterin reductase-like flavin-dependent oxidoreductase (luciferase family)|nr:LLM class flavin-dependent oxidoreductase [Nitrososphaerota archaeon]MBT5842671.1 LLM class flavin-dependent oxidoreductase [Nitrososphaerota archaeon]MBT6468201.1 LLM class flavin-dependent oxidoreductase [Nitrososphaerota archaeon]
MRIACSLGSLLSVNQVLECSEILSKTRIDSIWIPETWGMENFSMLGAVSNKTQNQKIGSSIINIYSRSPTTIAMGASTTDILSDGRLILGLGTSSIPIVEDFHGDKFEKPIQRMKEYVEIIRLVLSGKQINYSGKIFNLKNFTLLIKPKRELVPIYLAAINQKMVNLAWSIGDGVIFYLRPIDEMKKTISKMQSEKKIDVACQIITCIAHDAENAVNRAKKTLAFYVSVGEIYRKFLSENGFKTETENIFNEFKKSGFKSNHELVTDSMLNSLCISGTPEESKLQLKKFRDVGIDLPIIQFNPVGDTMESFLLMKKTLLDE